MIENAICRQLLPGHENDLAPLQPTIYYDGLGELFHFDIPDRWVVRLPPGTKLEAAEGSSVHVVIKEKP